jgi:phage antirepressor YoqD-like protein
MQDVILAQTDKLTMSSREIAELTGKEHKTVMRDVRIMLEQLNEGTDLYLGQYVSNSRTYDEYNLPKRETLLLVSGYSIGLRAKIIDRLEELETKSAPQLPGTFAEALQLAADQAKQLELAAPKVKFVDNLVERSTLMTATQIGQKHKMSAVKLNRFLDELGGVYSKSVKRGRVFIQAFLDSGYGEMKQTEQGHSQALFTPAGEVWINEKLISEGVI